MHRTGPARAACPSCPWSSVGAMDRVREELTMHFRVTYESALTESRVSGNSESAKERRKERALAKAHYPLLEVYELAP